MTYNASLLSAIQWPIRYCIHGIDISLWNDGETPTGARQPYIDWSEVNPQIDFAMVKASEQTADPEWEYNAAHCTKLIMPYCFYRCDLKPEDQAKTFAAVTKGHYRIRWIDVENYSSFADPQGIYTTYLHRLISWVQDLTGDEVGIYSRKSWIDPMVEANTWIGNLKLWVSHWKTLKPAIPRFWESNDPPWHFWQWDVSDKAAMDGIYNKVDVNVFYGLEATWQNFISNASPTPPPALDWQHSIDAWARTMGYKGVQP